MENFNEIVLNEIYAIADNLIDISFQNNDNATWLNIKSGTDSDKNYNYLEESNFSLLNGVLGDALFFFTFSNKVNDHKYHKFSNKVYEKFKIYLNGIDTQKIDTGLLTGLGGIIYIMTKIHEITRNPIFLNDLEMFLRKVNINELIFKDEFNSIVRGNSGLLISLCKYYQYSHEPQIEDSINNCCGKLIEVSKSFSNHIFWLPMYHKKALAGVAHGASGYALAFHEAYKITKNRNYLEIVKKTITFENTLFNQKTKNWLDNRDFVPIEMKGNAVAWSHGAPGIGLIRNTLLKSKLYDTEFNKILSNDLNLSINKTIQSNLDINKDILIYGNLGNIDLLINTHKNKEVKNQLEILIEKSSKEGWNYGYKSKKFYQSGFFNGSSGIGYQLLRFLDDKTPSILSFE